MLPVAGIVRNCFGVAIDDTVKIKGSVICEFSRCKLCM